MSVKIDGSKAEVHWLSNKNHGVNSKGEPTLVGGQIIVYNTESPFVKHGQVADRDLTGKTPAEAFCLRYTDKSMLDSDFVAQDIYVLDKSEPPGFAYDEANRRFVARLHKSNSSKFPFDALYRGKQGTVPANSEKLVGFDGSRNHRRLFLKILKKRLGIVNFDTKNPIEWRWGQEDEVNEIHSALVAEGRCLYAAYTGRGKTTISVGVVTKLLPKGGLVLVTTPIKDTRDGFEDKIEGWHFYGDRNRKVTFMDNDGFSKTTVEALRKRADSGELIFIVLTVQDLRWQSDTDAETLRNKYQALAGNLDVWIRDEFHKEYNAELTAARLGNLTATYTLDLTATPYGLMDGYTSKQVVSRTLIWGLLNRKHTDLPQLYIDAIATPFQKINPALASVYSEEEGYDPRKQFAMKNGNFVFRSEFIEFDRLCYGSGISKNKNPLSIVNDTELSPISTQCGMWRCPEGTAEYPASEYLPMLAKMMNAFTSSGTYYVTSYYIEDQANKQNKTINEYVNDMLKNHKRVVILTCGKFTTGTDIEALGHIILMDNITSINVFEQLMGRMMRVLKGKESVKLYSLMPGQQIKIVLGRLRREAAKLMGASEVEMFDCIPFTEYDTGKPRRVDVSELLKAAQEWSLDLMREGGFRSTEFDLLTSTDLGELASIVPVGKRKGPSNKMLLNEKNNSKVKTRKGGKVKAQKDSDELPNRDRKAYFNTLQSVFKEIRWVSKTQECYDLNKVLDTKILRDRFGNELMDCLIQIIKRNPKFAKSQSDRLSEYKEAFAGLSPNEYHDLVFQNSKENQKTLNLVYSSMKAADFIVKNVEKADERKPKTIGVMNAQSGSVVMALQAKYPKAKITCLEEFTHFRHLLEDLGVEIETLNMASRKTYDLMVAMPPIDIRTYRKYFKYAVEHARLVACLMPYITDDRENELHRNRVKEHKILISKSLAELYPDAPNYSEVRCVVASGVRG